MIKLAGIYKIQSISHPELVYIGGTKNFKLRGHQHHIALKKGVHWSKKMQQHANEYGLSDLMFCVLEICLFAHYLRDREQYWMDKYAPAFNSISAKKAIIINQL